MLYVGKSQDSEIARVTDGLVYYETLSRCDDGSMNLCLCCQGAIGGDVHTPTTVRIGLFGVGVCLNLKGFSNICSDVSSGNADWKSISTVLMTTCVHGENHQMCWWKSKGLSVKLTTVWCLEFFFSLLDMKKGRKKPQICVFYRLY